ncbi:MAG: chromophore lyase CpcT/CpeT [Cyanobacteria bacterium P01_A01_bin.123]
MASNRDLVTLAQWMAGDFSNSQQAAANPREYAHIHVFFRPLAVEFFAGIGFYSEQVYDHDLWTPYRQGIHRLVEQGDHIYIENYGLTDPIRYAGAAREPSILKTITLDCITRREHCSMVFRREDNKFVGCVEPGNLCLINKRGCQTYLVSDVEITETTWASLDRGLDVNTHEQVWGSEHGSLKFEKQESFAHEVPTSL